MAVIGIDLGTTNSLVSCFKDGKSIIIPNSTGENLTPSVVSIDDEGIIITGNAAKERLITNPDSTASSFKRTIGQPYYYSLKNKNFNSTELSALILKSLKEDAEKYLGEEVTEAVISVPAYFNQNQRKATKDAAVIAGLKVERLISEPTAAALSYGIQNNPDMNTVIVFDLGGGTFDVSLLEFFDGVIDVKAVSGDNHLGGDDFTKTIAAWFLTDHDLDMNISSNEMSALIKACEIAKRTVTNSANRLLPGSGAEIKVTIGGKELSSTLTYAIFSQIVSELMGRLSGPVYKVLHDAEIELDDVDSIILMGGSTKMCIIPEFVEEEFGCNIISSLNPDETVALGAGILAAMKAKNENLKETVLTDICPFTLGTDVLSHDDNFSSPFGSTIYDPIIERNSPVPISIEKTYVAATLGQKLIQVPIYQGESLDPKKNLLLGTIKLPIPINLEKRESITVRFTYDINGLLEVEVTSVSTGDKKSILINQSESTFSPEELEEARKKMEALKILPWEEQENRLLLERGERLYEESLGSKREFIAETLTSFKKALASQNPKTIKQAAQKLKETFDSLEQW